MSAHTDQSLEKRLASASFSKGVFLLLGLGRWEGGYQEGRKSAFGSWVAEDPGSEGGGRVEPALVRQEWREHVGRLGAELLESFAYSLTLVPNPPGF